MTDESRRARRRAASATVLPAAPSTAEAAVRRAAARSRTLWGDAWYRLRRNKLALIALDLAS